MVKIPLSQDVDEAVHGKFYELAEKLPINKNELLALMIRVFNALPDWVQDELVSKRPGLADTALKKLSQFGSLESAADALKQEAAQLRSRPHQKAGRQGA